MDISNLFNPGLYKITCLKNNKIYIGQSSNILSRLGKHVEKLENNKHDCLELQNDFNQFGKKSFLFEILEINSEFLSEDLRKKEKLLINEIPDNFRYNRPNFKNSFSSQVIKINNKIYSSLNEAAKELKESRTNLLRKCLNPSIENYTIVESEIANIKKYTFYKSQACVIDGVFYSSLNQAAKRLKTDHKTIKNRILSEKYPNYNFFTDERQRSNDYPERE
jgi:group I intron endonuclease